MPTFGSLFAGIGGFDLGLERAGWTCRWQVELDDFCQRVLARHWPGVARYRDVCAFPEPDTERVDLICGGFPCQPVALPGLHLAQGDERWLWPEFARVVRTLRPRYVLVENVAALLVRGFGDVLRDLAAAGFDAEWCVLRADEFGAPHLRERVFVLAYANEVDGQKGLGHFQDWTPSVFAGSCALRTDAWVQTARVAAGVGDGFPRELYEPRVGSLGNAIVPQVAEWIGRRLLMSLHPTEASPHPGVSGTTSDVREGEDR